MGRWGASSTQVGMATTREWSPPEWKVCPGSHRGQPVQGSLCSLTYILVPSLFLYIFSFPAVFPAPSSKPALHVPLQYTCPISGTCTFVSSLTSTQLYPSTCISLSQPYYLPVPSLVPESLLSLYGPEPGLTAFWGY